LACGICGATQLLSTARWTFVFVTIVTVGFADTNFGGKLVGILNTLASVFASSTVEFCDAATATPARAVALLSGYNIHAKQTYTLGFCSSGLFCLSRHKLS